MKYKHKKCEKRCDCFTKMLKTIKTFLVGTVANIKDSMVCLFKTIGAFFYSLFYGNCMPSRRYPRTVEKFIEVLIPLFDMNFEQDEIILGHGQHEVLVETECPVKRVWFTFTDVKGIPICQGAPDMCGITVVPEGFIINASINSSRRGIRYFATLRRHDESAKDETRTMLDD